MRQCGGVFLKLSSSTLKDVGGSLVGDDLGVMSRPTSGSSHQLSSCGTEARTCQDLKQKEMSRQKVALPDKPPDNLLPIH